jgi:membrane protease YdiL (CAAX protease family)
MNRFDASLSLKGIFTAGNRKPTLILLLTPLLLTTFKYYGARSYYLAKFAPTIHLLQDQQEAAAYFHFFSSFLLFGAIPLLIVRFVFREPFAAYGLQIGDWRFGLKAVALLAPLMILAAFPASRMPQFLAEYPLFGGAGGSGSTFLGYSVAYLTYYVGWETFFRGFMQFGLRGALGDWNAILVQTLASCLIHIGKPDGEIFGAILAGVVWGLVAFRSRSILYVLMLHWLLGTSLDLFIIFAR